MGEPSQSNTLEMIAGIFQTNGSSWNVKALQWETLKLPSDRERVPALTVFKSAEAPANESSSAPLLCIEVLTNETVQELQERVNDYAQMGVRSIWAIHPGMKTGYHASEFGFKQPDDGILRVEGTPIKVALSELFPASHSR